MKQRKIFLGLHLPAQISKRLADRLETWESLPLHWAKRDNWHITLLFIGHVNDEAVATICERVAAACTGLPPFDIAFEHITFHPQLPLPPKMLWLTGEASEELRLLRQSLEQALDIFVTDKKAFRPHVMLGRVREKKWQALAETPVIDERFSVSIPVDAVTVFESIFENGRGLVYEPVGIYELEG